VAWTETEEWPQKAREDAKIGGTEFLTTNEIRQWADFLEAVLDNGFHD
jgi:hypothetical protein